jgi:hypothetical protein
MFVVLCSVPGRQALPGNGAANAATKETASHWIPASGRPLGCDVCAHLLRAILSYWQDEWTAT